MFSIYKDKDAPRKVHKSAFTEIARTREYEYMGDLSRCVNRAAKQLDMFRYGFRGQVGDMFIRYNTQVHILYIYTHTYMISRCFGF